MTVLATLPLDVLDRVLTFLPDFSSLRAAALACKSTYSAYKAHPTSLTKAVAFSLVPGRALAAALKAIRIEHDLETRDETDAQDVKDIISEHDEARALDAPFTWDECKTLEKRARICARIETLYSRERKDRASGASSRLSADESEAFQKAVHRIWLLCHLVRFCIVHEFDLFDSLDDRKDLYYDSLTTQDLWDLRTLRQWFCDKYSNIDPGEDEFRFFVMAGPEGFIRTLDEDPDYNHDDIDMDIDEPLEFSSEEDFHALWHDRNVDVPASGPPKGIKPLLVMNGANDVCEKCRLPFGMELYNESNVDYAQWLQTPEQLTAHLLHHLCNNAHEVSLLRTYVRDPLRDLSVNDATMNWVHTAAGPPIKLSRIWHELLDLPNVITSPRLQAHMLADGFSSLTVDDWLCRSCLTAVLRQRLWIWWWNEKARGRAVGAPLLQDCWYGYECWTQVKIPSHGAKLNHLCVSTNAERQAAKKARDAASGGDGTQNAGPSSSQAGPSG